MENIEVWKDVLNYEGIYLVSNLGRVKSLTRLTINPRGNYITQEKILKNSCNKHGYVMVGLCKKGVKVTKSLHQLVAVAFLNHKPNGTNEIVVDHVNRIKTDNNLSNLQLISNRENSSKDKKLNGNTTSIYTGVIWCKRGRTWISSIRLNGKSIYLGRFKTEIDAHNQYQNALLNITLFKGLGK